MDSFREKFAVYSRVSTAGQADNTSPQAQRDACVAYGESKGWELLDDGWFHDVVSGTKGRQDRTKLDRILSLVESKVIKHVVIKKVDRLSRKQDLLSELIKEIYLAGGKVSIADKGVTYPTFRACAKDVKLEGFFAEYEWAGIAEKNLEGRINQFLRGSSVFKLPFGYVSKQDPDRRDKFKIVTINPEESAALVDFLEKFAETRNIKESIDYATEKGYKVRTGKPFTHHFFRDTFKLLEQYNGQEFTQQYSDDDNGITHTRTFRYPQIVSDDLYQRVKEAQTLKNKANREHFDGIRPYQGLIFCSHCGGKGYVRHKTIKKETKTYSTFLVGCTTNRTAVQTNYRLKGKHGTAECGKSFRYTDITNSLLAFLDTANKFGTVESYSRELSVLIRKMLSHFDTIITETATRDRAAKAKDKIVSNFESMLEMQSKNPSLDIKPFIEANNEKLSAYSNQIDISNGVISSAWDGFNHIKSILESAGLILDDETIARLLQDKQNALRKLVSMAEKRELKPSKDREQNKRYTENLVTESFMDTIINNLATELSDGLGMLRELVLAGEWESVNSLLYRLGIRFIVDFDGKLGDGKKPDVHTVVMLTADSDPINVDAQNTTKGHALKNIPMLREALNARGVPVRAPEPQGGGRLL